MTPIESPRPDVQGGRLWPLGVKAYRALGELGLIPEKTELLYGQVFHKMSESPLHRFLVMRLLASTLHGPGGTVRSEVVPGFAVDLAGLGWSAPETP